MKKSALVFSVTMMLLAGSWSIADAQEQPVSAEDSLKTEAPAKGPSKLVGIVVGALLGAGCAILVFRRSKR